MALVRLVCIVAAAWLFCGIAAASEKPSAPASPAKAPPPTYKPVDVTLPTPAKDPSFIAFRAELAQVAKRKVYAELARLVVPRGFFWDRDFGSSFDPDKTSTENLAFAVGLEARGGAGWDTLAAFAVEPTAGRALSRPGVICSPAKPKFDEADFLRLLKSTKTTSFDWLYPRDKVTAVQAEPDPRSAIIDTVGQHFVRVLPDKAGDVPATWRRVLTPHGKNGFIHREMLSGLSLDRLCYSRDIVGRWHIAGYVSGGD